MSEEKKKTNFKLFEKLKNIKHIEIYITIIFAVVLLLIFMSSTSNTSKKEQLANDLSVLTYIDNMETNLEEILSNIGGVEDVKVMITLDMTQAQVADSKINLSTFPEIKGVVITAKGVDNTSTKMKVLHAIEAVIEIKNGNIEILSSN